MLKFAFLPENNVKKVLRKIRGSVKDLMKGELKYG